jgi:carbonic anhydrase
MKQAQLIAVKSEDMDMDTPVVLVTPVVPAEEALAALQAGNARAAGKETTTMQTPRGGSVDEGKHDPFAVVFMGFDPHRGDGPLIELIFDTHPSNLATISLVPPEDRADQNAARRSPRPIPSENMSSDEMWQGYLHLAEHCIAETSPRLLLVMHRSTPESSGRDILAIKLEVMQTMLQLLHSSKLIKAGVADGQLQVEGALYSGRAMSQGIGHVEWLGAHPEQAEIIHKIKHMGTTVLTGSMILSASDLPGEDQGPAQAAAAVDELLQTLKAGNRRYVTTGPPPLTRWRPEYLPKSKDKAAKVIVLAGANGEARIPEYLFDSSPGDILVHRTCGGLTGRCGGVSLSFLENLVRQHPEVQLLLILGDVLDPVMKAATTQVQRIATTLKCPNAQMAIEQLGPPVVHAWRQMQPTDLDADSQQQRDLAAHATELHVIYRLERVLRDSELIIGLVQANRLQVQGAIAQADGTVKFLGGHAGTDRLFDQRKRIEKHRRKGLRLGPARH